MGQFSRSILVCEGGISYTDTAQIAQRTPRASSAAMALVQEEWSVAVVPGCQRLPFLVQSERKEPMSVSAREGR